MPGLRTGSSPGEVEVLSHHCTPSLAGANPAGVIDSSLWGGGGDIF